MSLKEYMKIKSDTALPEDSTMLAVTLSGTGFDSLSLEKVPVPKPEDDQVVCRLDACTVCPSILKLIRQGSEHKFINGWDLKKHPVIIGDEGAVTVIKPGRNLKEEYKPGEKYAIQPAVDHEPVNHRERYRSPETMKKVAVGYTLGGSFAQYILIKEEVLKAGCLVKLPSRELGYYEISLSEPLSCVVSSQDHHVHLLRDRHTAERKPIKGLRKDGVTVVFGAGVMGKFHVELALTYRPRFIVIFELYPERFTWIKKHIVPRAEEQGIKIFCEYSDLSSTKDTVKKHTGQDYADDIIDTSASPAVAEYCINNLTGYGSVYNSFGGLTIGKNTVPVDMRKVHYDESMITGSSGGNPYDTKRTLELIYQGNMNMGSRVRLVGDLSHAIDFLKLLKDGKVDGKAVIYPHTELDKPLEVDDNWTVDREREHLEKHLISRENR